jgi:hypothetical protein
MIHFLEKLKKKYILTYHKVDETANYDKKRGKAYKNFAPQLKNYYK